MRIYKISKLKVFPQIKLGLAVISAKKWLEFLIGFAIFSITSDKVWLINRARLKVVEHVKS